MNERYHWDKQLPHGVADLFFEEAAKKRKAEEDLRELFFRWGYTEIIPPTFEYYESLATEAGAQLQEEMYRFFDREGRTLALRADLTIPIARIVGTKLFDQPLPLRFCYTANVFRYEEPRAGLRREFSQAGVELIGAKTAEADAEVIALLVKALQAVGLAEFRVDLGQIAFFKALLADATIGEEEAALLRRAIDLKDSVTLERLLSTLRLPSQLAELLASIPHLQGGLEILGRAEELCSSGEARDALQHLRCTYGILQEMGVAEHVYLDLSQLRGMEYYTGLLFQAFAPGVGFPICGGGRYDNLIAHFGPPLPAIGFAISVERLLLALEHQARFAVDIAPHLILSGHPRPACFQLAEAARCRGLRVEVDALGRDTEQLIAYGKRKQAHRVLCWTGEGWLLVDGRGERALSHEAALQEIITWNP